MDRWTLIIEPVLADMGFELVRAQFSGSDHRAKLQIMAEPMDGRMMNVEDCEAISRRLSAVLDVADPIKGAYNLEISSPGLDRPLTRLKDFERFAGEEAKIEMKMPVDGRKHFKGHLGGLDGENILCVLEEGQSVALPFAYIFKAKLVLTEQLMRRALSQQRQEKKRRKSSHKEKEMEQ